MVLMSSCSSIKHTDFGKRKYLHLHSKATRTDSDLSDTDNALASASNTDTIPTQPTTNIGDNSAAITTNEIYASTEDLPLIAGDNSFTTLIYKVNPTPDDTSKTPRDEIVTEAAIKDQLKIMNPRFRWTKVLLIFALIFAAAVITLFFTINVASLLGELLIVLLIFDGLFTVVGISCGLIAKKAAKRLSTLSKDETELQRARKVSKAVNWLIAIFLAVPLLGMLGLVIYNNV